MEVTGTVADGYEPVREAFLRNFTEHGERGAGVVAYRDGHRVVDLWGGTRDIDGSAVWEHDTAQIIHSATKGVAAAALLLLYQRGQLDLDAPVGLYWPEYRAHGKEGTLVRHILAHQAGVPVLDHPLTPANMADFQRCADAVAAQTPVWEPGTDHGYHAKTYGWLTGELVRRVTGRSISEWIAEEIARPLALDLWIGLPPWQNYRVGRIGPVDPPDVHGNLRFRPKRNIAEVFADPSSLTNRAFEAISPAPEENSFAFRTAVLPSTNGIATADALARFYASLIGYVDGGTRLFTPETAELARTEASGGPDRVLIAPNRFGLGYMLHCNASPLLAPNSFGHPGRGGALGFADPDTGTAFGYITNDMRKTVTADTRAQALVRAVRSIVSSRS